MWTIFSSLPKTQKVPGVSLSTFIPPASMPPCSMMMTDVNIWGPYEPDPCNPILTSSPENHNERADWDHLKPRYYNPDSKLQKCGHASYVNLPNGETWLVHLTARPFTPELRCTLGRETAIQRMKWTEDGWLRMEHGGNLAQELVPESSLPEVTGKVLPSHDDFDLPKLGIGYYAPRIDPARFTDLTSRPGWIRLRGQESGCSLNKVSLLARKLTSVKATATTRLDFTPLSYQHTAGLILYYDNMNFIYLYKYFSDTLNHSALSVLQIDNGVKREFPEARTYVEDEKDIWMRLTINERKSQFQWSFDGVSYLQIGPCFDTSLFSDEYSDFDFFDYVADETADVV